MHSTDNGCHLPTHTHMSMSQEEAEKQIRMCSDIIAIQEGKSIRELYPDTDAKALAEYARELYIFKAQHT